MTPEQINREIAEKVMGFSVTDTRRLYYTKEKGACMLKTNWEPCHRIDHAMMALDTFGDWMLEKTANDQYYCRIGWGFTEGVWATTKEEAICLAVLRCDADPPKPTRKEWEEWVEQMPENIHNPDEWERMMRYMKQWFLTMPGVPKK